MAGGLQQFNVEIDTGGGVCRYSIMQTSAREAALQALAQAFCNTVDYWERAGRVISVKARSTADACYKYNAYIVITVTGIARTHYYIAS